MDAEPMQLLLEHQGRRYLEMRLPDAQPVGPSFSGALFPCLVWDHAGTGSREQKLGLAASLIKGGCRYAVCGGRECSDWERAFDVAFVDLYEGASDEELEAHHVMTTSHVGASPEDVALFFVFNTNFADHDFREHLILHVGTGPEEQVVNDWVRRHVRDA